MTSLIILLFLQVYGILCQSGCVCENSSRYCGIRRSKRVAGGEAASHEDLPWMAYIVTRVNGKEERCGGTLINDRFVLTSASCVENSESTEVYLGVTDVRRLRDSKVLKVSLNEKPLIHPDNTKTSKSAFNNFALLKLRRSVDFSRYPHIRPACLPDNRNIRIHNKVGVTGGYGHTDIKYRTRLKGRFVKGTSERDSNVLKKLDVRTVDQNECNDIYKSIKSDFAIDNENVCVISDSGGDLCTGDKGGGLVIPDCDTGTVTLVGVSSYSIGCNSSISGDRLPSVFGRVSSVLPWLQRMTASTPSCSSSPTRRPPSARPSLPSCSCGDSTNFFKRCKEKIIGGKETCPNEFPWAAHITVDGLVCGGSLLNDRFILTAAHCLRNMDRNADIEVVLGEHNLELEEGTEITRKGIKFFLHPSYQQSSSKLVFDFAVIEIEPLGRFYRSSAISPICLPSSGQKINDNSDVYATGWGYTEISRTQSISNVGVEKGVGGTLSKVNKRLDLKISSQRECQRIYQPFNIPITESQVCAVSDSGDSCDGDSGGGLISLDGQDTFTLIGVVSYGIGCNSTANGEKIPGVYARVSSGVDWIKDIIKDGIC